MSNFRPIDRQTGFLLPPSVDEWLPEKHLARFVVEVIDGLDLRVMRGSYRGSGSASYPPSLLLGILVYGYATGVFSSRKLERASYDSVAFRFIAANQHPDHDTIAAFRRRFLQEIEGLFVQVLAVAREAIAPVYGVQTSVLEAAHRHDVTKLLFLGSSCIYPKHAPQPMPEDCLLTGPLEPTNEGYALSNGVRVILKPTDFKADEVLFTAFSKGGSSLVADPDYASAAVASWAAAGTSRARCSARSTPSPTSSRAPGTWRPPAGRPRTGWSPKAPAPAAC